MSSSLVQVRIDKELRDDTSRLFESLGLDMSTAIKIFLKKCLMEDGIPFSLQAKPERCQSIEGMAAMLALQKQAEKSGLTDMSLDEINEEIAAARAERKQKTKKGA